MRIRNKNEVIKPNQRDIRSYTKDTRIVISEDKTNVSNIGKEISESSLLLLKENKLIKNVFIDMTKKNVAQQLKEEIERQIVSICDKKIWDYQRKKMKSYIERRFYKMYDYKKEKLSAYQIRSPEDYDKFLEPRKRITVPWNELTWDQFIYSNMINLTVHFFKLRLVDHPNAELNDELMLSHLESYYKNCVNNGARKIPFRSLIEFYEMNPGCEVDFRNLVPSEVKMTKFPKKSKFDLKYFGNNFLD